MRHAKSPNDWRAKRYGLVSHWPLDEPSLAARKDVYGPNTLEQVNGVTSGVGLVGVASTFTKVASCPYLKCASHQSLEFTDEDFWFAFWGYRAAIGVNHYGMSKEDNTIHNVLYVNNLDNARFSITVVGGSSKTVTSTATLAATTWYFLMGYHDAKNDIVAVCINGAAFETASTTGSAPLSTSAPWNIGSYNNRADTNYNWDGRIQSACVGRSPPTSIASVATEIRDYLYNGGTPRLNPW